MTVADVATDLRAEQAALDDVVAALSDTQWAAATPSPGWTVFDQIAHLTYFDDTAATAIEDPERFQADTAALFEQMTGGDVDMDAATLTWSRDLTPADLLTRWRTNRDRLAAAAERLTDDTRVPWYGPPMGGEAFLAARLMEAWAHGQDIVDTVGAERPATDRLRHIAHMGVITRSWSYRNRGLESPGGKILVELTAPSGETWTWNEGATDGAVRGPAEDFCLVVTQRRHVDDTALETEGELALGWMEIAQAFAGGATDGPTPRS
ncbi:TIGR03084 family metal-binding protein [Actinospongicola halichondriae]|uniref:TIGR03084 family metal-binding protein n=1 Tax=Actinospongicola halichondriae TaxID=3236844 RepID=UPI003D3BBAE0